MSISEAVLNLVGDIPLGYEPLLWLGSWIVLLYLLCSTFSVIVSLFKFIGGR